MLMLTGCVRRPWADRAGHGGEELLLEIEDDDRRIGVADVDLAVEDCHAVGLVEFEIELLAHHETVEAGLLLDVLQAVEGSQELDPRQAGAGGK